MAEITVPQAHSRSAQAHSRSAQDQVLDVREGFETADGVIGGTIHIPMGQLGHRLNELDRNRPVIVVCRSGNRSAAVADALNRAGYTADTMAGGMTAWQRAGLPVTQL